MSKSLPDKTKNASPEPRRFGSQSGYCASRTFFQSRQVKEIQEIDFGLDDIGSRGEGVGRMEGYLILVPRSKIGQRTKVRIRSASEKFALAEKMA